MFTSQLSFLNSSSSYSHIFINLSISLFSGSSAETSSSLDNPSTAASDLLDMTDDHLATSHAPYSSWAFELCHSNRVRTVANKFGWCTNSH